MIAGLPPLKGAAAAGAGVADVPDQSRTEDRDIALLASPVEISAETGTMMTGSIFRIRPNE